MSPTLKAQLQIHGCVVLWGFTAILGKLITLPADALVWWRMLLVTLMLLCVPRVWRAARALPRRMLAVYAGIGVLVALHWLTFYGAIKLANASVAVTCIALAPVFVSLFEPWIAGRALDWRELLLGVIVVPGVALVVGGIPHDMRLGLAVGVSSAALVALFGALNKRYIDRGDPLLVTAIELGSGALFLTLFALLRPHAPDAPGLFAWPGTHNLLLLLVLAFGCTLLPFTLSLIAMRQLSAFASQLAVNLEPVYAIVLAVLLLGEQRELSALFYVGVAVILASVLLHPWLVRRPGPPQAQTLAVAENKSVAE
ncbi:EamA family transporter [Solimonas marina]|uniref:DMT family transporter n=1 Tax=Solimonas marina TaxID=2714601 RepID=A0A969W726_9GAMM|nr:DMT family transporter [Solimonas marina]NKF21133.1 DMT family transporter [Solimonas marina]